MKDQEFSKWLLSLGYLVLAIVILVNFIRQAPEAPRPRTVSLPVVGNAGPDLEQVKAQLEQERLRNRDLKKMLQEYQQAFGVAIDQKGGRPTEFALRSLEDVNRLGIPAIASHLAIDPVERPSPFIPGKNPFLSFLPESKASGRPAAIGIPSDIQIRCDPRVPLLMQGGSISSRSEHGSLDGLWRITQHGSP